MAHEVEILVPVFGTKAQAKKALRKFSFHGTTHVVDTYLFDPKRKNLQPSGKGKLTEVFRLRLHGASGILTYKINHYRGRKWLYADEHEITVSSAATARTIIERLGLKELVTVDNLRHFYRTSHYEIVLEEVKGLGLFLEVEDKRRLTKRDIPKAKLAIRAFLATLNLRLGKEENSGKPELMLRKRRG